MNPHHDLSQVRWYKSSYSADNGGQCVEVGTMPVAWRKSTYSGHNGGNCVEVADLMDRHAVRDSKNPDGPALVVSAVAWRSLRSALNRGR